MEHLIRQSDIIPRHVLMQKIHIIGAGAIGSHTSVGLSKMGLTNQTVWDFDSVSVENMNCQGYRFKDIGRKKVEALKEIVKEYSGDDIEIRYERFEVQPLSGIVVCAVDSMAAREKIWEQVRGSYSVDYIIDPRMGAENAHLYVMKPSDSKDIVSYEKTLYSDSEASEDRCTAKSTMYCASLLSGLVCKAVKDIVVKEPYTRVSLWNIRENQLSQWKKTLQDGSVKL